MKASYVSITPLFTKINSELDLVYGAVVYVIPMLVASLESDLTLVIIRRIHQLSRDTALESMKKQSTGTVTYLKLRF